MSLEELADIMKSKRLTNAHLVAYIRQCGDKFRCIAHDFSDDIKKPMKLVFENSDLFNPILDKEDPIHKDHWCHMHKLKLTPSEYDGCIWDWYVSDFTNSVNEGHTILIED